MESMVTHICSTLVLSIYIDVVLTLSITDGPEQYMMLTGDELWKEFILDVDTLKVG